MSYDKYPELPELLLSLLLHNSEESDSQNSGISAVESVFPALDMIRRAGPPDTSRDEIYRRVAVHLGSSVWHVREIAARTLCTLLLHDGWLEDISQLVRIGNSSPNKAHGVLMTVKFFLERRLSLDPSSASGMFINLHN